MIFVSVLARAPWASVCAASDSALSELLLAGESRLWAESLPYWGLLGNRGIGCAVSGFSLWAH